MMRLDRFLASQRPDISRSSARELCRKGLVTVNGAPAKRSDIQINEEQDTVCVSGKCIIYRKYVYIMLNKPRGVICATKDRLTETVMELIPPELRRDGLFPAGRLDKDTEGFVLITDDGELAHKMLSPKSHVPKTYFVRLEKPLEPSAVSLFSEGITIDGGEKCLPAQLSISDDPAECLLTIREGKFHQVKRMFLAIDNKVLYLKRISIGKLALDENLPLGGCLEVLHKDVDKLLSRE